MRTVKFYIASGRYVGWQKIKSFCQNYLDCKNWINSGNYLMIEDNKIDITNKGILNVILKQQQTKES